VIIRNPHIYSLELYVSEYYRFLVIKWIRIKLATGYTVLSSRIYLQMYFYSQNIVLFIDDHYALKSLWLFTLSWILQTLHSPLQISYCGPGAGSTFEPVLQRWPPDSCPSFRAIRVLGPRVASSIFVCTQYIPAQHIAYTVTVRCSRAMNFARRRVQ